MARTWQKKKVFGYVEWERNLCSKAAITLASPRLDPAQLSAL